MEAAPPWPRGAPGGSAGRGRRAGRPRRVDVERGEGVARQCVAASMALDLAARGLREGPGGEEHDEARLEPGGLGHGLADPEDDLVALRSREPVAHFDSERELF